MPSLELRRHVEHGTTAKGWACNSEVGYLHLASLVDQDIRRLEVLMYDPFRVDRRETFAQLASQLEHFILSHPPLLEASFQCTPLDIFHRDELPAVGILMEIVDPADIGMGDLHSRIGLDSRTSHTAGHEFQCYLLAATQVFGKKNLPHATPSQFPDDPETTAAQPSRPFRTWVITRFRPRIRMVDYLSIGEISRATRTPRLAGLELHIASRTSRHGSASMLSANYHRGSASWVVRG